MLQRKDGDFSPVKSLEGKKKDAVNAAMLKMPAAYKKKMLEDSLHVIESFVDTGYNLKSFVFYFRTTIVLYLLFHSA